MKEFIIIPCGRIGYLGILKINGGEVYRTGKHHSTSFEALMAVQNWDELNK